MSATRKPGDPEFNQIVLTAPDVDADNRSVLSDIFNLFNAGKDPDQRFGIREVTATPSILAIRALSPFFGPPSGPSSPAFPADNSATFLDNSLHLTLVDATD